MCRSYSDLNFGVTFFGTQCILWINQDINYQTSILCLRKKVSQNVFLSHLLQTQPTLIKSDIQYQFCHKVNRDSFHLTQIMLYTTPWNLQAVFCETSDAEKSWNQQNKSFFIYTNSAVIVDILQLQHTIQLVNIILMCWSMTSLVRRSSISGSHVENVNSCRVTAKWRSYLTEMSLVLSFIFVCL